MSSLVDLFINLLTMGLGFAMQNRYAEKRKKLMVDYISKLDSLPVMEVNIPNPPSIPVKPEKTVGGGEPCEPCAIKHLLSSKTFIIEGKPRKGEEGRAKILEAYRELQAAEQHLVDEHPDLAGEIRDLRKRIEKCALLGEECDVIDTHEIDVMIRKIIPHVPREYYFKPIEGGMYG